METTFRRKHHTATEREAIIHRYQASELTQREFARQQGIGLATLNKWLRRARGGTPKEPQFIPVPNLLAPPTAPSLYRMVWPGGLVLEVRAGFSPQELAALLQVLPRL